MIFAHEPMEFPLGEDQISKSVCVEFRNGNKIVSLALDNSVGKMTNLARANVRVMISRDDVTGKVFSCGSDEVVHASLDNFEKALRWLRQTEWGFENTTGENDVRGE